MTEDKKELPKEVVEEINRFVGSINYSDEISKLTQSNLKDISGYDVKTGAQIAQSHYEPIIESKDRIIAENAKIRELLQRKLTEKDATINKLMGLLKWEINIKSIASLTEDECAVASVYEKKDWDEYCKENNLPQI